MLHPVQVCKAGSAGKCVLSDRAVHADRLLGGMRRYMGLLRPPAEGHGCIERNVWNAAVTSFSSDRRTDSVRCFCTMSLLDRVKVQRSSCRQAAASRTGHTHKLNCAASARLTTVNQSCAALNTDCAFRMTRKHLSCGASTAHSVIQTSRDQAAAATISLVPLDVLSLAE